MSQAIDDWQTGEIDFKIAQYEEGVWPECYNSVTDSIWIFIILYTLIVGGLKVFIVRILFWWYKEAIADKEYTTCDLGF